MLHNMAARSGDVGNLELQDVPQDDYAPPDIVKQNTTPTGVSNRTEIIERYFTCKGEGSLPWMNFGIANEGGTEEQFDIPDKAEEKEKIEYEENSSVDDSVEAEQGSEVELMTTSEENMEEEAPALPSDEVMSNKRELVKFLKETEIILTELRNKVRFARQMLES